MSDSKNKSKSLLLTIVAIIILLIAVLAVSYAAFYYSKNGEEINRVLTGTITMSYSENNNGIYLTDAYPTTDSVGMALSDNSQYFDFTVSASMSGSTIVDYVIAGSKVTDSSTLPDEAVKVYLTSISSNREREVVAPTKISELQSTNNISYVPNGQYVILQDNFRETGSRSYRLRMWIASDYVLPETESLSYALRINVYGNMSA